MCDPVDALDMRVMTTGALDRCHSISLTFSSRVCRLALCNQ